MTDEFKLRKVDDFENWDVLEVGTAIGSLMRDLRGSWAMGYEYRMKETFRLLHVLKTAHESQTPKEKFVGAISGEFAELRDKVDEDIAVTENELCETNRNGRVFRSCNLYDFIHKEGQTDRVKQYLYTVMSYPEHSWLEVDEDE